MRLVSSPIGGAAAAGRRPRGFSRAEQGASAVEFALILPFLLTFMLASMQVGIYLGLVHSLEEMSAEASRYAVVGLDAEERRALVDRWLRTEPQRYALIKGERVSGAATEVDGILVVTLTYDSSYLPEVPFVARLVSLPAVIARSATQMVAE